ncbi:hypothetical protein BH23GEM11_BH23GEM11_05260 [soil metagenome]
MSGATRNHDCRMQILKLVARAGGARFFLFGVLFLAACDSSTYREVVEVEIPSAISLEPIALQLEEGADRGLTLVDSSKPRRPTVTGEWIAWSSSNPNVATVENGVVGAVGPGVAKLTARIGGTIATSSVRVVRTPTELEVRGPASREAAVATLLDEPIEARVLSATGRPVAGAEVRFNVVAGAGKVSPVVAETDANGIARAAWTYGLRTGPQRVAVEVLAGGVAKRSIVGQAVAGPAFSVRVTPEDVDLDPGIPFQFSAEFVDLYGNFVSDAMVDWSTSNSDVVQVGSNGRATGVSKGNALVVARPSSASAAFSVMAQSPGNGRGNSNVTVGDGEGGTSATVAIMSGNNQSGPVGQQLSSDLSIRITDASGSGVRHQNVTWTVTAGSATLGSSTTRTSPHGDTSISLTFGSMTGSVTVTATAGDLGSVTFQATAEPGSVASIVITPGSAAMEKGDTRQFGFSARDQFGNVVSQHAPAAWSTGSTSVASVTDDGTATALSGGTTTVRASVDGVVGSGDLTVSGAVAETTSSTVTSVHASSKSVSFTSLGMEATVFAVARDGSGQVVSDATFKWSSNNQGVATVNSAGKIISKGIGTALIVVSATCCEGASTDTITVSVTQVAKEISIDPGALNLKVGTTQGVKATLKDANGYDLTTQGTTTWTSSNGAVMTVSSGGVVTALGAGSATLTASSASLTTTAAVAVTTDATPTAEGGVAPLHTENFAGFGTVQDYLASIPQRGWPRGEARMDFEDDSPPGVGGQAIRFTFRDATALGGSGRDGRCSGPSIGFDYDVRPLVSDKATEVWDEFWLRYSPNWTTMPPAEWDCTGNPDHKLVFANVFGASSRFAILAGNGPAASWVMESPGGTDTWFVERAPGAGAHWNGEWFRIRRHMRLSSAPGVADGVYRVWVNDELITDSGPWLMEASEIWSVSLGRNRNHGAGEDMSVSFAAFSVWTQNPGW